ncbi:MAG: alkane 1-monooxygenase [Ferruginibacter sp.]
MRLRAFKYLSPLFIYFLGWLAFTSTGWLTWIPMLYAWVLMPLAELFTGSSKKNLSAVEEELVKKDRIYDYLLYMIVVLQFAALYVFLTSIKTNNLLWWETAGRICSMGLLCGTFGINVAHELGHRVNKYEQFFAKALLLTSLYMHFFIEHNKGHHKNVATPHDPSSAHLNEPVFLFYFRTVIFSYLSAWKIANSEMKKKSLPVLHWKNEMLQVQIIQFLFVAAIFLQFGWLVTLYFLAAATIGFLLLETVNYIEHYGLQRRQRADGNFERAMPHHSWNSNHILGRLMLFELSRHSDHHYLASRKYQVLQHHEDAPQLPTGYPGSMILALVPPLWFYIMNKKIRQLEKSE